MKKTVLGAVLGAGLMAGPAFAQSSSTWNGLPDRFQVDAGYFGIKSDTTLRFNGGANGGDEINFEKDLGLDQSSTTFWVDGTWRVGRRHTLKLGFTRLSRDRQSYQLQRDVDWGGLVFGTTLDVKPSTSSNIFSGYYRFAIFRNDRFEIGPALGLGHLSISAEIRATATITIPGGSTTLTVLDRSASTGNPTGAVGGYAEGWLTKRLLAQGDFLYIKVKPGRLDGVGLRLASRSQLLLLQERGHRRAVQVRPVPIRPRRPGHRAGREDHVQGRAGVRDVPLLSWTSRVGERRPTSTRFFARVAAPRRSARRA